MRFVFVPGIVAISMLLPGAGACQGYPANVAATKMTLPADFRAELVVGEPQLRQPVAIDFDDRGRLWVMQYLQYPNPEGLKRVKVDRYSRTAYDRVPAPPPLGPKGADRLTIYEPDPANPGQMKSHDFVNGLNLASGFAFGHGGVFVLQVPYLLFYPDRNRDDIPDRDPDVLLTGFGMEDAHSVANSLTWGPDGWLYGCQGSTVTANIRGIEFQQGVWRYHPLTHRFELFCEGGGNSWGLDFDRNGNLFYSTNLGPNVLLHGVQGGYYWKSFGKHGALHNPFAYGYFDHVPHENFRGGHVTVGGIVYRGDNFPAQFRDKYIAADLLGHAVYWHELLPRGSTFRSRHGGELLLANDTWFAPSDVCLGPDGCIYVADWSDKRTAHPDPDAEWDKSNGRVYRIAYGALPQQKRFDLAKKTTPELVAMLSHSNDWFARTARRILADRRDPEAILPLRTLVEDSQNDDLALQALWALEVSGGLDDNLAQRLLQHRNHAICRWVVRLLGDRDQVSAATATALTQLAAGASHLQVRLQLACTAKRLSAQTGLAIVRQLATHEDDADDPFVPMLLWWAVERHCMESMDETMKALTGRQLQSTTIARRTLLPRLIRRYAAAGTGRASMACAALVRYGLGSKRADGSTLEALQLGLGERPLVSAAQASMKPTANDAALLTALREQFAVAPDDPLLTRVLARLGDSDALARLLGVCIDARHPPAERVAAVTVFGEIAPAAFASSVVSLAVANEPDAIRLAALSVWTRSGSDDQAQMLIDAYPKLPVAVRNRLRTLLASRKSWAGLLLAAIEKGTLSAGEFSTDEIRSIAVHNDATLDAAVRKIWGNMRGPTPEEKLAVVRRLNNDVRAAPGNVQSGKLLFSKHCATCHKLFGAGGLVGPDLTHANRGDRDFLLVSLVDPSGVIRKEYLSYTAETTDGRVLTGIIVEQSANSVTIVNAKAEKTTLKRDEIATLRESPVSIMPDDVYKQLKPQELRDLFAYLQSSVGKTAPDAKNRR